MMKLISSMVGNNILLLFILTLACSKSRLPKIEITDISIAEGDYETVSTNNVLLNMSLPIKFNFSVLNYSKDPILFYENGTEDLQNGGVVVNFHNPCLNSINVRFDFGPANRRLIVVAPYEKKEIELLGYITIKTSKDVTLDENGCNFTFENVIHELIINSDTRLIINYKYLYTYKYLHNLGNINSQNTTGIREYDIITNNAKLNFP